MEAFPCRKDFGDQLEEMLQRTKSPNETYSRYYYEKMALLNACEITGRKAVSYLIKGIRDVNVQISVRGAKYEKPEALHEHLRTLPDSSTTGEKRTSYNFPKTSNKMSRKGNFRVRCFACKEIGHKTTNCPKGGKPITCSYCKKIGHTEERCYTKKNREQPSTSRTAL